MCAELEQTQEHAQIGSTKLSNRAFCIMADNPSPMTYTGTNTWILADPESRDAYIVDPGPLMEDHLVQIDAYLHDAALNPQALLLTHMHLDHSEAAEELADRLGIEVYARDLGNLEDGEFFVERGPQLTVVSLPGHSSDSVGFCFPDDRSIVTGDVVFLQSPTAIVAPDGNLKDYFETLDFLRALVEEDHYEKLLSAHGPSIDEPLKVIDDIEAHRLNRLARVRGALTRRGEIDIDYIITHVYDDIDTRLNPAARMNVMAQIDYLKAIKDPCIPH